MLYLVVFTHVDGAVFATRSHLSFYDAMSFGTLMAGLLWRRCRLGFALGAIVRNSQSFVS